MTAEELQALLQNHFNRYPLMQPQDVVKLLYQNEFGPGHLVTDPEACLERLKDEFSKTVPDESIPLIENIGNGLVRINLANMEESDLSLEDVTRLFIESASEVTGDRENFLKTLDSLRACYTELKAVFSYQELIVYLDGYIANGCPMVSHSETYRKAYHPAYRVVKEGFISRIVMTE